MLREYLVPEEREGQLLIFCKDDNKTQKIAEALKDIGALELNNEEDHVMDMLVDELADSKNFYR